MAGFFRAFASFDQLAQSLADRISVDLETAVRKRGRASLVVPGGTTPGAFFDVLSRCFLSWHSTTVTLTDERWVPTDSEHSNERLVCTRLLVDRAAPARFVSLKTGAAHAQGAETQIAARLSAMVRPFDVVLAGMGDDGHTASWIPGSDGLRRALDPTEASLVCAIVPSAGSNLDERMTLTLRALTDSRAIYVLLRGEEKRKTYERASAGANIYEMPIRALLQQDRVPVELFWSIR